MLKYNVSIRLIFLVIVLLIVVTIYGGSTLLASRFSTGLLVSRYSYLNNKVISYNLSGSRVLGAVSEKEKATSVPVLVYHGVLQEAKESEDVSWDDFRDQMFTLKDNGYETINLNQLEEFLLNGKPLPKKSFLLTFDDGRRDSYYPVDPILKALNYKAVMFVLTSQGGDNGPFYLSENELNEMLSTGRWELQSHSENAHKFDVTGPNGEMGHWLTNKLWLKDQGRLETNEEYKTRIESDLVKSKEHLEAKYGVKVTALAFPYGDYGQGDTNYSTSKQVVLDAVRAIYKFGLYQPWGELGERNYPGKDGFMVRRITVRNTTSVNDLLRIIENGEDKAVGYTDSFQKDNGWITEWGKEDVSDGALRLRSTDGTSGAVTYLDGTEQWNNFELTATVALEKDTDSLSIIARADRFSNYSYCNFGKYSMSYSEIVDGQKVLGNKWSGNFKYSMSNKVEVGIRVEGGKTTCSMNGVPMVINRNIKISRGGMIGFSIWSSKANAEAQIFSLISTPINQSSRD